MKKIVWWVEKKKNLFIKLAQWKSNNRENSSNYIPRPQLICKKKKINDTCWDATLSKYKIKPSNTDDLEL